jgi:hypothetical protein
MSIQRLTTESSSQTPSQTPAQALIPLAHQIASAARANYAMFASRGGNISGDLEPRSPFFILKPWVDKKSELTQEIAMKAMKEALVLKKPWIIYYVLGHGPALPDACYTELFKSVFSSQILNQLQFFLSCQVPISQTYLALQARQLAFNGKFRLVAPILMHLKTPFVGAQDMVVMAAALKLEVCALKLLSQFKISPAARDAALEKTKNPELLAALSHALVLEPSEDLPADLAVADPVEFLLSEASQSVPEYQALQGWLSRQSEPSEADLQAALYHAAVTAPVDVVRFLMLKRENIETQELVELTYHAASFGRIATVSFLLSQGSSIDSGQLSSAVKGALKAGQTGMFQYLISDPRRFSQADIDSFFYIAADGSSLKSCMPEIIRELLSKGLRPSQSCLGQLAASAAADNSQEILQLLLSMGRTLEPNQLKEVVTKAALSNNISILQFLFSDGRTLSVEEIGQVFVAVARPNCLRALEFFFTEGRNVSQRYVAEAMVNAAMHGQADLLRFLVDTGIVTRQHFFGEVIEGAIQAQQLGIARWLLTRYTGDFDLRQPSVMRAAQFNYHDIVEELLRRGPISERCRNSALTLTRDERIRDLLNMVPVTPGYGGGVVIADQNRLLLPLAGLKAYPERWLKHVAGRGLPSRVRFVEFPQAVDLGGVMKQFISTLCQSLIEKNVFSRQSSGLMTCETEQEAIHLRQLGKFFSDLAQKNERRTDKFLTGRVCHPRFFEFSSIAKQEKSLEAKLLDAARLLDECDPMQRVVTQVVLNPTPESCQAFLAVFLGNEGEEVADAKNILRGYLNAAVEIYNGATQSFQTRMLREPVATLLDLQGEEASVESLLRALVFDAEGVRAHAYFDWIREEIVSAGQEFRKKLLKSVTGKTTLSPADRIKVKETWRADGVFEIHTCFNMLDLPRVDLTRHEFISALHACLDENYNIA